MALRDQWVDAIFSTAERDLRWGRVRQLMAAEEVEAIICLPCSNNHNRGAADVLYLTQMGQNSEECALVMTADEVRIWAPVAGEWPTSNWLDRVDFLSPGSPSVGVIEYLREQGIVDGKVGVAGMTGGALSHCREQEGEVNWRSLEAIMVGLPAATFLSATDLLGIARFTKSSAEIEFLRRGTGIAEAVVETIVEEVRVGRSERDVFGEMMRRSAIEGGTFTPMFGWISGPYGDVYHRLEQPSFRSFEMGDLLSVEVDGRYGGYIAQIDQAFICGAATRDARDAMALTQESFDRVMEVLKPGALVGDVMKAGHVEGIGGRGVADLGMHGRGTGDDGPLVIGSGTRESHKEVVLAENCVMCVKPGTRLDGRQYAATWGETVLVGQAGGERLGTRARTLIELPR